jgi:glycosyltransferase involved in cell wall biosynthesis
MSIQPGSKLLFCGLEFQQKVQRGTYFYAKSLISAAKQSGYLIGLLSEARHSSDQSIALVEIAKTIQNPPAYLISKRQKLLKYLGFRFLSADKGIEIKNQELLVEEELWFLKDVDYFLNVPRIYDIALVANVFGITGLPVDFRVSMDFAERHGYRATITASPMFATRIHRKHLLVQTVHDLIPVKMPMQQERHELFYARLKAIAQSADLILAMSEFTRRQFIEMFPHAESRTKVLYQPLPASPLELELSANPLVQAAVLKKYGLCSKKFFFYVGAVEPRKNIHRLIDAYQVTQNDLGMPLAIAGPLDGEYLDEKGIRQHFEVYSNSRDAHRNVSESASTSFARAGRMEGAERVRFGQQKKREQGIRYLGYITNVEKLCLIRNATALVFPTLTEGFGIPALEAQSLGCPVITSNVASLPEVCGSAAKYINDPFRVEEIASALIEVAKNEELREQLSAAGLKQAEKFSNTAFASEFHNFMSEL